MKRILALTLCVVMLFALGACAKKAEPAAEVSTTIAALREQYPDWLMTSNGDEYYIYIYNDDEGRPMRALAPVSEEFLAVSTDMYMPAEELAQKMEEESGKLQVERIDDLSVGILPQEKLDAFIGWTGQQLMDEGYRIVGTGYNGETASATLEVGLFRYEFVFNEAQDLTENPEEDILPLTVKSVYYVGVSDQALNPNQMPEVTE